MTVPFHNKEYDRLFSEHYVSLCNYAFRLLNCADAAEDVVQDSFVYLWENWERLQPTKSLPNYLLKAVKNRSLNLLKSNYSRFKNTIETQPELVPVEPAPTAQEVMEYHDLEAIVSKALEELPEKCRLIYVLKRFEDMSTKEVAAFYGISAKTVENQMTIAFRKMHAYVQKHWGKHTAVLFSIFISKKMKML